MYFNIFTHSAGHVPQDDWDRSQRADRGREEETGRHKTPLHAMEGIRQFIGDARV